MKTFEKIHPFFKHIIGWLLSFLIIFMFLEFGAILSDGDSNSQLTSIGANIVIYFLTAVIFIQKITGITNEFTSLYVSLFFIGGISFELLWLLFKVKNKIFG